MALITGRLSQFHPRLVATRQLGVRMRHQLLRTALFMAQGKCLLHVSYHSFITVVISIWLLLQPRVFICSDHAWSIRCERWDAI